MQEQYDMEMCEIFKHKKVCNHQKVFKQKIFKHKKSKKLCLVFIYSSLFIQNNKFFF